ncbi:MAG: hypothetical protein V4466_11995 [Pseudomonadota bacterium]
MTLFPVRAHRAPGALMLALAAAISVLMGVMPAAAQVTALRDAQGHPYEIPLGIDMATGLSCVPAPSALTCLASGAVSTGAGNVDSRTQRVTLASDDPLIAALTTPAPYLPLPGVQSATSPVVLTYDGKTATTSGDLTLVTATSSQFTWLHRMYCTVSGATTITFKHGSTTYAGGFDFPSTGGALNLEFSGWAYFVTAANEALILNSLANVNVKCQFWYVKAAA